MDFPPSVAVPTAKRSVAMNNLFIWRAEIIGNSAGFVSS